MTTLEHDLRYLEAGAPMLEEFLLSHDWNWPIGINVTHGHLPYLQLSVGGLLIACQRIHARLTSQPDQAKMDQLCAEMGAIRQRWHVAWQTKAGIEFHHRLSLWRNFLVEYREQPGANYDRYHYEVSRRAQLHLLQQEAQSLPAVETELLHSLDLYLKAVLSPGAFIWEADLEPAFPKDTYWYLYGKLQRNAPHGAGNGDE